MQKLVTVVVPVYKVEKYLERCIRSIVGQTYQNLEIILVDDGSPDRCPEICDEWARRDRRIRVIHKENEGAGLARNTGMDQAKGEYIFFFDSDDYVDETTVEKACALAEEEGADIVVFGLMNINSAGHIVRKSIPESEKLLFEGAEVQEMFLPDLVDGGRSDTVCRNLALSLWTCAFSMKMIRESGWEIVSERQVISEDSYSLLTLYRYVKRVAVLPEALYFYCENELSQTHSYWKDRYERCRHFYKEMLNLSQRQGYCKSVEQSISGLFFAFVIGVMKHIILFEKSRKKQIMLIDGIVRDKAMQEALDQVKNRAYSKNKRVLCSIMRLRISWVVRMMVKLQTMRDQAR